MKAESGASLLQTTRKVQFAFMLRSSVWCRHLDSICCLFVRLSVDYFVTACWGHYNSLSYCDPLLSIIRSSVIFYRVIFRVPEDGKYIIVSISNSCARRRKINKIASGIDNNRQHFNGISLDVAGLLYIMPYVIPSPRIENK